VYSHTTIWTAVQEEAGDASTLTSEAEAVRWFNDGQARLNYLLPKITTLDWSANNKTCALPADFAQLDQIVFDVSTPDEPYRVFGFELVFTSPEGACRDGAADLYYRAYFPDVTIAGQASLLPRVGDAACVSYALSKFFRKLVANRALYKKYSTLLGQNAVGEGDLETAADAYYRDFLDTRDDLPVLESAPYFSE
jgi:hypothetical protein